MQPYLFLEHTGDIKSHAHGRTLPRLFVHAAQGMMSFLYGKEAAKGEIETHETIEISSSDRESLLVDWLSELLADSDTYHRVSLRFRVREMDETHLVAEVGSRAAQAEDDIKAVTYSELNICYQQDHWTAVVVFDI